MRAVRAGRGDGRHPGRALRQGRQGAVGAGAHGGPRRLGAVRGALARGHPHLLPLLRRPGHAARRHRPAGARRAAAGAGDAGGRGGRRTPGRHAALAQQGDAGDDEGDGAGGGAQGGGRPGEAARHPHPGDPDRRPGPQRARQPAAPPRHRLEPHHRGQPQALPARIPHGGPGTADRLRPRRALGEEGGHPLHRPVGLDGGVRGLRVGLRRGPRLHAVDRHPAGRLRHGRGRPHRPARRPGGRALRHPAGRRYGHQPGARLLPVAHQPARRDRGGADQRPLRGRHPRRDAQAGGGHEGVRGAVRDAAGAVRRGGAGLRPGARGGAGRARRAGLRLHARPVPGGDGGGAGEAPAADTGHRLKKPGRTGNPDGVRGVGGGIG
ncbi:Mg-chelatase subunit ChlD [Streptomyces misionensis JCM 4497]